MSTNTEVLVYLMTQDDELQRVLGNDWPQIRDGLVELIARLDTEADTPALTRDIDNFLDSLLKGPARQIATMALQQGELAPKLEVVERSTTWWHPDASVPGAKPAAQSALVPVFFATNRAEEADGRLGLKFGATRADELRYGIADVNVPANRDIGSLPLPRLWKLELAPDTDRHFCIAGLRSLTQEQWVNGVGSALQSVPDTAYRAVLLFIHGYNVTFEAAALQAAQISRDLQFNGVTALFSWASKGHPLGYIADGATIEASAPPLEEFLRVIVKQVGAATLDVIAHSMGTRALCSVLERFEAVDQDSCHIRQVIFAAPDVDAQRFKQLAQAFHSRARRCTLYSSRNDWALRLSQLLTAYGRAGGAPLLAKGVDTVDASTANTSLWGLGHSYFATVRSIIGDIAELIATNADPDHRFNVERVPEAAPPYWRYRT